jgi:hypothetical protein
MTEERLSQGSLRQMNVRIPQTTLEAGRLLAASRQMTLSDWVAELMNEKILAHRDEVTRSLRDAADQAAAAVESLNRDLEELAAASVSAGSHR